MFPCTKEQNKSCVGDGAGRGRGRLQAREWRIRRTTIYNIPYVGNLLEKLNVALISSLLTLSVSSYLISTSFTTLLSFKQSIHTIFI